MLKKYIILISVLLLSSCFNNLSQNIDMSDLDTSDLNKKTITQDEDHDHNADGSHIDTDSIEKMQEDWKKYYGLKNFKKALESILQINEALHGEDVHVLEKVIMTYEGLGDQENVDLFLKRALKKFPKEKKILRFVQEENPEGTEGDDISDLKEKWERYYEAGEYKKALESISQVNEMLLSGDVHVLEKLIRTYQGIGDDASAKKFLDIALKKFPNEEKIKKLVQETEKHLTVNEGGEDGKVALDQNGYIVCNLPEKIKGSGERTLDFIMDGWLPEYRKGTDWDTLVAVSEGKGTELQEAWVYSQDPKKGACLQAKKD